MTADKELGKQMESMFFESKKKRYVGGTTGPAYCKSLKSKWSKEGGGAKRKGQEKGNPAKSESSSTRTVLEGKREKGRRRGWLWGHGDQKTKKRAVKNREREVTGTRVTVGISERNSPKQSKL